jgi:hypothetical protein
MSGKAINDSAPMRRMTVLDINSVNLPTDTMIKTPAVAKKTASHNAFISSQKENVFV